MRSPRSHVMVIKCLSPLILPHCSHLSVLSFILPFTSDDMIPVQAVSYSEESQTKCIGLTIETRPDYCLTPHLKDMLSYGCTRLEMGVQSIYEDVARDTNRGHTVESVKECFCLAKVSTGFPNSTVKAYLFTLCIMQFICQYHWPYRVQSTKHRLHLI